MRLPVDIPDLMRSGGKIREAREQAVRIAVFIEEDAPDELVDAIKATLYPETANARIHVDVVSAELILTVDSLADAVVAVVGSGSLLPKSLTAVRDRGVPCAALVLSPDREVWARLLGHPVRDVLGDTDPLHLVRTDLGAWLADRLDSKKLALAANFEFMRRVVAQDSINTTAFQNAAIGAAPFLPGTDMPIMTANQMKMVLQIAAAYGEALTAQRVRELAVVLGGGLALRAVARTALGFIPGFGWAVRGGIGYTGTIAMGWAAVEYFEAGGSPAELAEKMREAVSGIGKRGAQEPLVAHAEVVDTVVATVAPGPLVLDAAAGSADSEAL